MNVLDLVRDYFIDQEDTMKKLITFFRNLVMESKAEQQADSTRYERSVKRIAYRNGKRSRSLKTKFGDIILNKPDFREKPF
jgi:putative transposase